VAFLLSVWSSFDATAGYIVRQVYDYIDGQLVINLTTNALFTPDAFTGASEVLELTDTGAIGFFEGLTGNPGQDNFGSFIRGYIEAPQTGAYTFWVASDDNSELWLSTDSTVANKKLIASVTGADQWTNVREYGKYPSQQSAEITLAQGQKYYVEVYHKEGASGDNISVGWQLPDGTMQRPMPAYVLAPYWPAGTALSIKTQPQAVSVDEAQPAIFSVSADGAQPITYQWYRGSSLITGATLSWYSINQAKMADNNASFYVNVIRSGTTIKSDVATLTVYQDVTPPQIVSAQTLGYPSLVQVSFSEPVTPATANSVASYAIDNGVTVTKAVLQADGTNVLLTTGTPIASGKTYTITANGVKDFAAAPNSTSGSATFNQVGALTRKVWTNITGGAVSDLTGNANYPNSPNEVSYLPTFEGPVSWGFNYGQLIQGYVIPTETGNYTFALSSDDGGQLFLSTDANPANLGATPIALVAGYSDSRQYLKTNAQMSAPIPLVAGQRYYIRALQKQATGGDNLSVTWQTPSGPAIVDGTAQEPIPGVNLASDDAGTFQISQQPQSQTNLQARPATFTIAMNALPNFTGVQWYRNGSPVPAGNSLSYTVPFVSTNDNGAVFYAVVSNLVYTATSSNAVLTVNSDNVIPTVAKVIGSATFDTVTVSFSEQVDLATATNKSNYTISPAMVISGATLDATLTKVFLQTPTQTQGASYTITVKNVQDLSGNVMTNTTKNFTGFVFGTGVVMRETYTGLDPNGWGISALTVLPSFQNHQPNAIDYLSTFEGTDAQSGADYTGWRFYGLLVPPETGEYQFFSYCEDEAYTYLSTDENPANLDTANPVIYETVGWNTYRNWDGDSMHWVNNANEVMPRVIGPTITLQANTKYYIEARVQNNNGGYRFGLNWRKPSDTADPVLGTPALSAQYVGWYVNPDDSTVAITQSPTNFAATANQMETLTVVATGTNAWGATLAYQWQKNGQNIIGANSATYVTDYLSIADNGAVFRCVVSMPGVSRISGTATASIAIDVVKPTLVKAVGSDTFDTLTISFSEPVDPATATAIGNYSFSPSLTISEITLAANKTDVILKTSAQAKGVSYTVTANNVQDLAGNVIVSASNIKFTGWVFVTGVVKREAFWSITDMNVAATTTATPDVVDYITGTFDSLDRARDNFTERLTGLLVAPETGNYQFYVAADDQGEVFISTDENPANLGTTPAIHQGGWNDSHNWLGDAYVWSDTLQTGVTLAREIGSQVSLQANTKYYIMALKYEGANGDFLGVNWKKPSDAAEPASGTPSMSLQYIGLYMNPDAAVLNIIQDPANTTVVQGLPVTFTVVATGTSIAGTNVTYQWKRANADIVGANSASYTIAVTQASDNNAQFKCVVSLSGKSLESQAATLTVIPDTVPPTLTSAFGMVSNRTVTVNFSEKVDPATAANLANYTVNGTAPTSAVLSLNGTSVVLTMATLTGATANVLVSNIKDLANNTIASGSAASAPLNSSLTAIDIGTAGNPIEPGLTSAVGASDFDVRASGTDIWDNTDGFHFVYEEKTGDFDVVVRVQRLDPTSPWAKAGLMARENLTPGSRNLNVVVDPAAVETVAGGLGANLYEANNRPLADLYSTNNWADVVPRANAGVPYPNAWMRLKRAGNEFRGYRSYDGSNWIQIAQMSVIDSATNTAYPSKVYVGMATTSHNNTAGNSTVAEYRSYGNYVKPALPEVLFVIGGGTPNAADQAVISHLATKGYLVTAIPSLSALTADATGKALVIVSSTVDSAEVAAKYRDVAVPVIAWENGIYDDMGLTIDDATHHNSTVGLTNITIVNASHPMAAGLAAGDVTVTTIPETLTWGVPNANAVIIANVPGGQAAIFGYETGAVLYTNTAPARRVGFFLQDNAFVSLTGDGMKLFDAAVAWAVGVGVAEQPRLTISQSANKVTLAWPLAGSTLQSTPTIPATNWTDVAGSATTNRVEVPIGPANEFFRLK